MWWFCGGFNRTLRTNIQHICSNHCKYAAYLLHNISGSNTRYHHIAALMNNRVTKRVSASLPDATMEKLKLWAEIEGTSLSDLTGYILRKAVEEAEEQGKLKKPKETR